MPPSKLTLSSNDTGGGESWRRGPSAPPGYVRPYDLRHRPVTSKLTNEEHAELKARAEARGIATTTLATQALREYLAREIPALAPDDFDGSNMLSYQDGE